MIAPETLLRMYPLDALRAQLGEVLKQPLLATHLRIEKPKAVDGVRTSVTVSVDKSRAPVELWGIVGEQEFFYNRLDLTSFLQGMTKAVKTSLPAQAWQVLGTILQKAGIPVGEDDVVEDTFTQLGAARLIASPDSYRWVGEFSAMLNYALFHIEKMILVQTYGFPHTESFKSADFKRLLTQSLNMANALSLQIPLTSTMYSLGTPVVNGLPEAGDNTQLTLTFSGLPYIGSVDIYYARRAFEKTSRFPVALSGGALTNTQTLAAALSAALGCTIGTADLASQVITPVQVGETRLLAVGFAPTSLCYVGEVWVNYTRTQ